MQTAILSALKHLATLASGLGKQKKLFILIYHRVLNEADFMRPGEVDKAIFSWQMQLLSKYFNVLSLDQALEKLENNQLPARAVCITFDDGYADNYLNAVPILKQFDLKATFFIANGYMNGGLMWNDKVIESVRNMSAQTLDLTEQGLENYDIANNEKKVEVAQKVILKIKHLDSELREQIADFIASKVDQNPTDLMLTDQQLVLLHQAGMEIGGHTVTHPILAKLDKSSVIEELKNNKLKLEQLLAVKLRYFAYPNGKPNVDYTLEQVEHVKSMGYIAAVSTTWGVANIASDSFQLPRFTPWDTRPVKFMLRMIRMYLGR